MINRSSKASIFFTIAMCIIELLYFKIISYIANYSKLVIIVIILNGALLWILFVKNKSGVDSKIGYIVFFSYVVRSALLIAKMYGFHNPLSGADDYGFYNIVQGKTHLKMNYPLFIKNFIPIIGDNRYVLEYFNVMISVITLFVFENALLMIIDKKKTIIPLLIMAFAPANILLSASFLRETLMIFLNVISIYYFIKWYTLNKNIYMILACLLIAFSAYFHSGVFFAAIAYAIIFVIYSFKSRKISIHTKGITNLVIILIIAGIVLSLYGNEILFYFNKINSPEDVSNRGAIGNTDYLLFLDGANLYITILFMPIKIFYFYISPMPWDCYNLSILSTFLFSSCIYLFLFFNIFTRKALDKGLKWMFLFIILLLSIVHGAGVKNSGTALRHREKMLPFVVCAYAILEPKEEKKKKAILIKQ